MQFWDFYKFLDSSFENLSAKKGNFISLDEDGKKGDLFNKKSVKPYENFISIDSFFEPANINTKHFSSTLKQSTPKNKKETEQMK